MGWDGMAISVILSTVSRLITTPFDSISVGKTLLSLSIWEIDFKLSFMTQENLLGELPLFRFFPKEPNGLSYRRIDRNSELVDIDHRPSAFLIVYEKLCNYHRL